MMTSFLLATTLWMISKLISTITVTECSAAQRSNTSRGEGPYTSSNQNGMGFYFVGMQWPMVLIMRPEDWKVISVSRKKVLCHEERYAATSDSVSMQNSIADFTRLKADLEALKGEKEGLETIASFKLAFNIPDHVLSVKSLGFC